MRFYILMEDGGIYRNAIILTSKGIASSKREVHIALKYDGFITVCCKYVINKKLQSKDIYAVAEE